MEQATENLVEISPEYEIPDEDLWEYFGLGRSPFDFVLEDTQDIHDCKRAILSARAKGRMLAIIGNVGAGKTTMLDLLERDGDLVMVRADFVDQYMISPAALIEIMIRRLRHDRKDGTVSKSQILRLQELAELLHARQEGGRKTIVLVLDDGQQFRAETLRILKRLRELSYWNRERLFEVVVLTHESGAFRLQQLEEVGRRFVFRRMSGLTPEELRLYVDRAAGKFFEPGVIEEFCARVVDRRYLVVQGLILQALSRAMLAGRRTIISEDIETGFGLNALLRRYNIPQSRVAEVSGYQKSTVNEVLRGKYSKETKAKTDILRAARELVGDEQIRLRRTALNPPQADGHQSASGGQRK